MNRPTNAKIAASFKISFNTPQTSTKCLLRCDKCEEDVLIAAINCIQNYNVTVVLAKTATNIFLATYCTNFRVNNIISLVINGNKCTPWLVGENLMVPRNLLVLGVNNIGVQGSGEQLIKFRIFYTKNQYVHKYGQIWTLKDIV